MSTWIFIFVVGILFWVFNLTGFGFEWSRDWPILLILVGLWGIIRGIKPSKKRSSKEHVKKLLDDVEAGKISGEEAAKKMEEK